MQTETQEVQQVARFDINIRLSRFPSSDLQDGCIAKDQ